jgi:hypothetical protein
LITYFHITLPRSAKQILDGGGKFRQLVGCHSMYSRLSLVLSSVSMQTVML